MKKEVITVVCVPYYKKFDLLVRLIESIQRQTFRDFIVVVTDDSADDRAKEYIESLGESFVYERNRQQKGPTANCNYAIEVGRRYHPRYIKVMHHDDFFTYDDSLERMVEELERDKEAIFVATGGAYIRGGEKISGYHMTKEQLEYLREDFYRIIERNVIGPPSLLLVRNYGIYMDENLKWIVDEEWYFKLLEYQNHFAYLDEPLVSIGLDDGRVTDACTQDLELLEREFAYTYVKHFQMQDSRFDPIVHNSSRVYDGKRQQGFYLQGDIFAIIRDAVRDQRKLGLWVGEEGCEKAEKNLREALGIRFDFYYFEEGFEEEREGVLPLAELLEPGSRVMWIILKKQARNIRRMFNDKQISAIPYNARHFSE